MLFKYRKLSLWKLNQHCHLYSRNMKNLQSFQLPFQTRSSKNSWPKYMSFPWNQIKNYFPKDILTRKGKISKNQHKTPGKMTKISYYVKRFERRNDRYTDRQTDRQLGTKRETIYPETKAIISFLSARRPQEDVSVKEWMPKTYKGNAIHVKSTSELSKKYVRRISSQCLSRIYLQ